MEMGDVPSYDLLLGNCPMNHGKAGARSPWFERAGDALTGALGGTKGAGGGGGPPPEGYLLTGLSSLAGTRGGGLYEGEGLCLLLETPEKEGDRDGRFRLGDGALY